ncbi:MAG: isoprenylcysteine carboxylmethyltransferase family protein [Bacteroidota bacterium]
MFLALLKSYDWRAFVGTRQLPARQIDPREPLVVQGLNAWVRHPLYAAITLVLVGALILSPKFSTLTVAGISLGYLRVGIYWEEKKLITRYGEAYERYRERVPMLIPRIWGWR